MMFPLILLAGAGVGFWFFMQTQTPKRSPEEISRGAHRKAQQGLLKQYPLASDIINQWDWTEEWRLELRDLQRDAQELHNQRAGL